jgi:hypothetical protein
MTYQNNALLKAIERTGALDRYGQAVPLNSAVEVPCRLEIRNRMIRTVQNDLIQVDAEAWLQPGFDVRVGDVLSFLVPADQRYQVLQVNPTYDVQGSQIRQTCVLVRRKG